MALMHVLPMLWTGHVGHVMPMLWTGHARASTAKAVQALAYPSYTTSTSSTFEVLALNASMLHASGWYVEACTELPWALQTCHFCRARLGPASWTAHALVRDALPLPAMPVVPSGMWSLCIMATVPGLPGGPSLWHGAHRHGVRLSCAHMARLNWCCSHSAAIHIWHCLAGWLGEKAMDCAINVLPLLEVPAHHVLHCSIYFYGIYFCFAVL